MNTVKVATHPTRRVVVDGRQAHSGGYTADDVISTIECSTGSIFSTTVKIEVQRSTVDPRYVSLLFSNSNRFWHQGKDAAISAVSKKPQEDVSKPLCTLFKVTKAGGDVGSDGTFSFHLTHVQSGGHLTVDPELGVFKIDPPGPGGAAAGSVLGFKDWSTLVKLPEHVAFKGPNGKYLQVHYEGEWYYLKFKGSDPYDLLSGNRVTLIPDGHIKIKADFNGNFWRRDRSTGAPDFLVADAPEGSLGPDLLFWPVKIDNATIALRSAGNNNFCNRMTEEGRPESVMKAGVSTMTDETRLQVKELIGTRKIYGVRYRMEDARIYGETPFIGGTTTLTNLQDHEATMSVSLVYQNERSRTFTNSLSITAGVSTTIQAGIPDIAEESVSVSLEVNTTFEWSTTTTETTSATATGSINVPPLTVARITYVGTKGTCDVPFSYMQQDTSSFDGTVHITEQVDGVYTGVNCYNFDFVMEKSHPIEFDHN